MTHGSISDDAAVAAPLSETRQQLKAGAFTPLPVREPMIPKGNTGKLSDAEMAHR